MNPVITRRDFGTLAVGALGALAAPASFAQSGSFPTKPIKIVAPFAPGGGTDYIARVIATKLGERLGQPVIVENRPGAGGNLGTEFALKSPADGYTLLLVAGSYTVNPSVYKLNFNPIADMTPVIQLSRGAYVLVVNAAVPAKTLAELLELMRKEPGKIAYGSSGQGGHLHIVTEYMLDLAKVKATHVPYKGTGPAVTDLIGGNVQMMFAGTEAVMQHVKAGKLRALAVGTAKRLAAFPDIPSVAEAGVPGYDVVAWHGLIAPKGVPAPIIETLNREINAALASKEMEDRLANNGVGTAGGSPAQFGSLLQAEVERYGKVIRQAGIKVDQ
ncbi:Tripartite-type tricarboxylate transporter, receptor component TctC [Polaromonas sp. OV174]|uniref:tripartite tricarboxylate transporter substrate binding protein n=1 Tax=Polaromonas sp. OV174 TaxID=1855300 RepID=UPI0008E8C117|nr:tripartite tricarboxylate transporter substrate binding protein [Polaromonas sp. OV174]SFC46082.1 Tripartite-type tricarboxylate transporter, receptor component TctC [Polaromonas sp. OV174]